MKLALVEPAGTVTLFGVVTALELSETDTVAPPLGAAAVKVTVPVDELPPVTEVGLTATAERATLGGDGFTVIAEDWNTPSMAAVSWTVFRKLGNVVTGNVALVAPPGTVTLAGTLAVLGWLLPRLIATPFEGAGPPNVTVPVAVAPPTTLDGLTAMDVRGGSVG